MDDAPKEEEVDAVIEDEVVDPIHYEEAASNEGGIVEEDYTPIEAAAAEEGEITEEDVIDAADDEEAVDTIVIDIEEPEDDNIVVDEEKIETDLVGDADAIIEKYSVDTEDEEDGAEMGETAAAFFGGRA